MFACWMLKVVWFMRTWFRLMRNGGIAEWWWGEVTHQLKVLLGHVGVLMHEHLLQGSIELVALRADIAVLNVQDRFL